MSRSTWACELKSMCLCCKSQQGQSRSTWACELKFECVHDVCTFCSSRSTWACELKSILPLLVNSWTVSRSTWACELKCNIVHYNNSVFRHAPRERVSWNNEQILKLQRGNCHAPRERVSWNDYFLRPLHLVQKSRSTWACELKWLTIIWRNVLTLSRSTWACELKFSCGGSKGGEVRHAPRERVSWNFLTVFYSDSLYVTLHVSVWVEIERKPLTPLQPRSRSTWACELKF